MSMETVLRQLETRIDELVAAHAGARARVAELEARLGETEARLRALGEAEERSRSLEGERDGLTRRLKQVLDAIDTALVPDQGRSADQ